MKKLFWLAACFFLFISSPALCHTREASFDLASGRAETIDNDENMDVDYYFTDNHLKISGEILPLIRYTLSVSSGSRDYAESEDSLDNSRFTLKNALVFSKEDERSVRRSEVYVDWSNKSFQESPDLNFSKTRVGAATSYKEKGSHKLSLFASMVNFSYRASSTEAENILDTKAAFEKYLFDGDLTLNCYSRVTSSTRAQFGTQMINSAGAALGLPFANFSEVSASVTAGSRNSRMDDDYEEDMDYDYHFTEFVIGTEDPLAKNLSASTFYTVFEKTYTGGSYDSSGCSAGASLKYIPFENFRTGFDYAYREKKYPDIESLTHFKNNYSLSAAYRIREEWGVTAKTSVGFYEFPGSDDKDRIDNSISVKVDRYLFSDLQAYLSGEYRMEDHLSAADLNLSKWKLGADCKW